MSESLTSWTSPTLITHNCIVSEGVEFYIHLGGEWVTEQFLNGTSEQYWLFSVIHLKGEEKYEIHTKCIKQNK